MGAQLIARLTEQFDIEIPLRAVFEAPTIESLSAKIECLMLEKVSSMSDGEAARLLA